MTRLSRMTELEICEAIQRGDPEVARAIREKTMREIGYTPRQIPAVPMEPEIDNPYMTVDPTRPCSICHTYCYGDCRD